jgi:hypothetical protein
VAASRVQGRWRQLLMAGGFPLSSLALGAAVPAWLWLVGVLPLLAAYPLRAWTDAPFFPTPAAPLRALGPALPLPDGARVLDAGCGLGHGLRALQVAWPQARVEGVEWSALLAAVCVALPLRAGATRRHVGAPVDRSRGGLPVPAPREHGARLDQGPGRDGPRPLAGQPGVRHPGVEPQLRLDAGGGRPLWVYRVPLSAASGSKKARRGR